MPTTYHGIGTTLVPGRGLVEWSGSIAVDAVVWFVVGGIPIIPIKAVHAFDWVGDRYRCIPIRPSSGLLLRTATRSVLTVVAVVALVSGLGIIITLLMSGVSWLVVLMVLVFAVALSLRLGGLLVWDRTDRRARYIRLLLGRHDAGASDPVYWTDEMRDDLRGPEELFGMRQYASAVAKLLGGGEYSRAMWAARLATALEDAAEGEALTDEVLSHPGARTPGERACWGQGAWTKVPIVSDVGEAREQ